MKHYGAAWMTVALAALMVPAEVSAQTALSCGQNLATSISAPGEVDAYAVGGVAPGDVITVRMMTPWNTNDITPRLELYDGSSTLVAASTAVSAGNHAELNLTLNTAGPYTLLASDSGDNHSGVYSVFLQRVNNPCDATSLACGQRLGGSIGQTNEFDTYALSNVGVGDRITLFMTDAALHLKERLELFDGAGTLLQLVDARRESLSATLTITLSTPGPYTLLARESGVSGTGAYDLYLERLNNPCNSTSLLCGSAVAGELNQHADHDYYTFQGSGGDKVRLWMSRSVATDDPHDEQLTLFNAAGAQIAVAGTGAAGDGAILQVTLPATGRYTIRAQDLRESPSRTYPYSLFYQRLNNPCSPTSLTCGSAAIASIGAVAEVDTYALAGFGVGDRVTLRMSKTAPGAFAERFDLFDGGGTQIATSTLTSAGATVTITLTTAGPYTLLVTERGMDLTSAYRVFVQRLNGACAPALLSLCQAVHGSLSSVAEIDTYTLSGVASGDPVSISMVKSATASLVEHIELYAGNGTSLGTATSSGQGAVITTTLPLTAPYTVLARDATNSTAGEYRLTMERTDAACPGVTFTDDPLSASVTAVRAVHFTELRQAIDELRLGCGLEAFGYADAIASGVTIRAAHLIELRTALNEVFDCRDVTRPTFTDPAPVAGQTLIKAVHIDELRRAVESIQ